jgi:hypothetical protein
MPIRFRCHHCSQLLGIARRKAGTHVQCPTCRREVLVPAEDGPWEPNGAAAAPPAPAPAPAPVPAPAPAAAPALFERDDFELLLRPQQSMAGEPRPVPGPVGTPVPPTRPHPLAESLPQPPPVWASSELPPAGLVLSPTRATVLTVVVILLLAVAFGAGLLVGRFFL